MVRVRSCDTSEIPPVRVWGGGGGGIFYSFSLGNLTNDWPRLHGYWGSGCSLPPPACPPPLSLTGTDGGSRRQNKPQYVSAASSGPGSIFHFRTRKGPQSTLLLPPPCPATSRARWERRGGVVSRLRPPVQWATVSVAFMR